MGLPRRVPVSLPGVELFRVTGDDRCWRGVSTQYGLTLVSAGAFEFWYRRATWTQTPGTVKLKEPGEVHRDLRVLGAVDAISIQLAPALVAAAAAALDRAAPPHFRTVVAAAAAPLAALVRRLDRALAPHDPPAPAAAASRALAPPAPRAVDPLAAESLLAATLTTALADHAESAAPPPPPLPLRRARAYLEAHLATAIRLDDLAAAVGLDKFTLVRAFTRTLGLPPYAYLSHLRVARARALLARGLPPAEVALAVGYCDQPQLHRHFTRVVGIAPGAYRRASRSAP